MASTKTALASLQVEVQQMVDAVVVLAYLGKPVLITEAARIRRLVERLEGCLTALMHGIRYTGMQGRDLDAWCMRDCCVTTSALCYTSRVSFLAVSWSKLHAIASTFACLHHPLAAH